MRLSAPEQLLEAAPLHRLALSCGALESFLPQLGWSVALAQAVQTHLPVSLSGSTRSPPGSLVWKRPRKWPGSCAAMYAPRSAPPPKLGVVAVHTPANKSLSATAAPLLTVPVMLDGPG